MSTDRVNSYEGGVGKVIVQGMRINKTAAQTTLGTIRDLAAGRQIVYAKVGAAAVSAGDVLQTIAAVALHQACSHVGTASVGAKQVTITLGATAAAADLYQDGFFCVISGAGAGYSYMVDYHRSCAASADLQVYLKDGLEVALTSLSICSLIPNKYTGVIATILSAASNSTVGVALCTGSINSYVWLGKKGIFLCEKDAGAIAPGAQLINGSAAGTVGVIATATVNVQVVGKAVQSAAAGAVRCMVDLDL